MREMNPTSYRSCAITSARAHRSHSCPDTLHILKQITVSLTFNLPACNMDKAADSICAVFVQQSSWCDSKAALGAVQCQGLAFPVTQDLAELFSATQNAHTQYFNNVHRRFGCRERLPSFPSPTFHSLTFQFPHAAEELLLHFAQWKLEIYKFCSWDSSVTSFRHWHAAGCVVDAQPRGREEESGTRITNWEIPDYATSYLCHT